MATIAHSAEYGLSAGLLPGTFPKPIVVVTWSALSSSNNVGGSIEIPHFPDKCVQIACTNWGSGNVSVEGSNDNNNWVTLTNPQGNNATKSANSMLQVMENPRYLRPNVLGADLSNMTVTVVGVQK